MQNAGIGASGHNHIEYRDGFAVADIDTGGQWRKLEPGMTLTVEPGCYIRPDETVLEKFWNIGIRIEDDALVTDDGCDIITAGVSKSIADIEAVMAG